MTGDHRLPVERLAVEPLLEKEEEEGRRCLVEEKGFEEDEGLILRPFDNGFVRRTEVRLFDNFTVDNGITEGGAVDRFLERCLSEKRFREEERGACLACFAASFWCTLYAGKICSLIIFANNFSSPSLNNVWPLISKSSYT